MTLQVIIYTLACLTVGIGPILMGWSHEWYRPLIWLGVVLGYRWLEQVGYQPSSTKGRRKQEWLFYAIYLGLSGSILLPAIEFAWLQRPVSQPLIVAGVLMAITGAWLRYQSVNTIGRHFSTHIEVRPEHQLVDSGVMRFVRHPGYAGTMIYTLGAALVLQSFYSLAYIGFFWVLLLIRMRLEEKELSANLPGYSDYMNRTKRLIPFVF